MRFIFWLLIWLLTLCSADISVKYKDGLSISFRGWIKPLGRWYKRRSTVRPEQLPAAQDAQGQCEHGKGLTDYCQPCGRIHGG